jgi:hypothetical protein
MKLAAGTQSPDNPPSAASWLVRLLAVLILAAVPVLALGAAFGLIQFYYVRPWTAAGWVCLWLLLAWATSGIALRKQRQVRRQNQQRLEELRQTLADALAKLTQQQGPTVH